MKKSLDKKDSDPVLAQKEASRKAKEAEDKLKAFEKWEEEKKTLEDVAKRSTQEAVEAEAKLKGVTTKKAELEKLIEDYCGQMNKGLKGTHSARSNFNPFLSHLSFFALLTPFSRMSIRSVYG